MNSLKTLQTLAKLGKIFSKIIFICCIVGASGCVVGAFGLILGNQCFKIAGISFYGLIQTSADIGAGTLWASLVVGAIFSIGEIILANRAYRYFSHLVIAETPFTIDGARELMHLGIWTVCMSAGSTLLAQIVQGILAQLIPDVERLSLDFGQGIALGVMFLVVSVLCRYGAELRHKKETES